MTIQSGSVADLVLNDQMTQEDHESMVKKGASQMVKGVRLGNYYILYAIWVFELTLVLVVENGQVIRAPNVVITTGTFLGGEIHLGLKVWPAGRIGENPSIGLSNSLKSAGFKLARLKTGTSKKKKK